MLTQQAVKKVNMVNTASGKNGIFPAIFYYFYKIVVFFKNPDLMFADLA